MWVLYKTNNKIKIINWKSTTSKYKLLDWLIFNFFVVLFLSCFIFHSYWKSLINIKCRNANFGGGGDTLNSYSLLWPRSNVPPHHLQISTPLGDNDIICNKSLDNNLKSISASGVVRVGLFQNTQPAVRTHIQPQNYQNKTALVRYRVLLDCHSDGSKPTHLIRQWNLAAVETVDVRTRWRRSMLVLGAAVDRERGRRLESAAGRDRKSRAWGESPLRRRWTQCRRRRSATRRTTSSSGKRMHSERQWS